MLMRKTHDEPTMNCGRREESWSMPKTADEVLDGWHTKKDGTRTCSYCGSLHEDDFIDILEHYNAGDAGYYFGTTHKLYKWYAHRPGYVNADDGGGKFYSHHVDRSDPVKLQARAEIVELAYLTLQKNLEMQTRARQDGKPS